MADSDSARPSHPGPLESVDVVQMRYLARERCALPRRTSLRCRLDLGSPPRRLLTAADGSIQVVAHEKPLNAALPRLPNVQFRSVVPCTTLD
jgi:hypothetical protein